MVFGIFSMLGYRFAPRFADLGDQRFWRADLPDGTTPKHGPLEAIARKQDQPAEDPPQGSDLTRVAGSLVTNQVRAYDLLRMFARGGRPTPLGQAFAEYGRIDKTLHLLSILDPIDDTYRRRLNKQLTAQESWHRPARKICHGNGGRSARPTAKDKKTNWRLLVLSSTRSRCGTRSTCRPPSTSCAPTASRSQTRTPPGSARLVTPTSTSWAATSSPPPPRPKGCGSSARFPTCPTATAAWTRRGCSGHDRRPCPEAFLELDGESPRRARPGSAILPFGRSVGGRVDA
jgi:hypothetical protein